MGGGVVYALFIYSRIGIWQGNSWILKILHTQCINHFPPSWVVNASGIPTKPGMSRHLETALANQRLPTEKNCLLTSYVLCMNFFVPHSSRNRNLAKHPQMSTASCFFHSNWDRDMWENVEIIPQLYNSLLLQGCLVEVKMNMGGFKAAHIPLDTNQCTRKSVFFWVSNFPTCIIYHEFTWDLLPSYSEHSADRVRFSASNSGLDTSPRDAAMVSGRAAATLSRHRTCFS